MGRDSHAPALAVPLNRGIHVPTDSVATSATSMLNKVPAVTLSFWIIKILATTVGETGADFLAFHAGLGVWVTDALTVVLLALALLWQLRGNRYIPWIYWVTVVLLSVAGTQLTDALTDSLDVSLYASTVAFSVLLAAWFAVWFSRERTLSIRTIVTRRRELFYWGAILLTFALGTAAGDLATEELGLGFRLGALVFGGLIAGIAAAYVLGVNSETNFWLAYILTRPLGASMGDWLSQPTDDGGLGLGTVTTSATFVVVIASLVFWLSRRERLARRDINRPHGTQTQHFVSRGEDPGAPR